MAEQFKVILVDDDKNSLMIVSRLLQELPVEIHISTHGQEAIELFRSNIYILVVMDIIIYSGFIFF